MGALCAKSSFDELKYPSYCPNVPVSHDDHLRCLESWTVAARTRPNSEKSFILIERRFTESLAEQAITTPLPQDFLICVVSTLINGRQVQRATAFRNYNLSSTVWSAVGTALLIAVKHAYEPEPWTEDITQAWLRCYGALLREVFRIRTIGVDMFPPSALVVPGVSPRVKSYSTSFPSPKLSVKV